MAESTPAPLAVGKAQLNISEVLIFPQNKIQLDTKVMSIDTECRSHMNAIQACSCQGSATRRRHLGNLSVWFRLTCEMDTLKMHSDQLWSAAGAGDMPSPKNTSKPKLKSRNRIPSDKDTDASTSADVVGACVSTSEADETFVDRQNLMRGKQVDFKVKITKKI